MAKEGETFFFYLPTCPLSTCLLVYFPRQLVNLSLVNLSPRQPYPIQLELCKKIYKVL